VPASWVTGSSRQGPASESVTGRRADGPRISPSSRHTPQVTTAATAVHRIAASPGTRSPRMTSSAMTPAEPSQKTEVTSHLIAAGGGFRACTSHSSAAELARMTGIETAATTAANPSRNASDARRRVVPRPGPEHHRTQPPGHRAPVRTRNALARDRRHRFLLPRGRPGSLTARSYWRAMAIRISLSVSVMRSPDRSTVTVCRVPVNGDGAW